MKTAKEACVDNKVRAIMECSVCGATTHIKVGIDTQMDQSAIERLCVSCNPNRQPRVLVGIWS